ncbi:hypothetical protein [Ferrimicrobium sp.]|uniref:alpha/beta hydrolase family protein n=1 Tax=Ferrimicrobium sp. TaxID=2926050 RepID=UPI002605D68C|nr:hypothetical protein [Ferrimicrobium sp.]
MPVDQLQCEPAGLSLFVATVKESSTPGRPAVLYSPGIAETDIGGSSDRVLQEAAERLSFYCRTQVIGMNPHGIGESEGTLGPASLVADLEAVIDFLAPQPLVLIGFGLVGYAMLAAKDTGSVLGVVTVDPLVDQLSREELLTTGVRLDPEEVFPFPGYPLTAMGGHRRWMLIIPGDRPRSYNPMLEHHVQTLHPELHRVYATSTRLHNDPRPYALILGWLERELWSHPVNTA